MSYSKIAVAAAALTAGFVLASLPHKAAPEPAPKNDDVPPQNGFLNFLSTVAFCAGYVADLAEQGIQALSGPAAEAAPTTAAEAAPVE